MLTIRAVVFGGDDTTIARARIGKACAVAEAQASAG